MGHADRTCERREVGRDEVGVDAAAAILGVLDVADHAVAEVVHQDEGDVGLFLHRGREFAQAERQPAVADQRHGLAAVIAERGADGHREALADAAAERVHALARTRKIDVAVAPGAVRDGDVAHPGRALRHGGAQIVDDPRVRAETVAQVLHRGGLGGGKVAREGRVDRGAVAEALDQAQQGQFGVAFDEEIVRVGQPVLRRVGIDAGERLGQAERVLQSLVAAQARAHRDHEVGGLVEVGHRRHGVEGAEAHRVAFRHDAAAVHAGDDADAHLGQLAGLGRGCPCAAAEPEERALGVADQRCEPVERGTVGDRWVDDRRRDRTGQRDLGALDVDRDLDADWSRGRGKRGPHRLLQYRERVFGARYAEEPLRDRLEHARLVRRLVDVAAALIEKAGLDLAGQMEHRRAGGERLDEAAGGVTGRNARGGHADAKPARHPREGVGHVERARLAARRHEAHAPARGDRVEDRHVVDRDDAESGADAAGLEIGRDQRADRRRRGRALGGKFRLFVHEYQP